MLTTSSRIKARCVSEFGHLISMSPSSPTSPSGDAPALLMVGWLKKPQGFTSTLYRNSYSARASSSWSMPHWMASFVKYRGGLLGESLSDIILHLYLLYLCVFLPCRVRS